MSATVMITGGTGFLGHALVLQCLEQGYRVRALVRDPSRLPAQAGGRVETVLGDLGDPASVTAAARGSDAIFHVAAIASDWTRDPADFVATNVDGTRHVLEAARAAGVSRVVATSTVMALGPSDGLDAVSETTGRPARWSFTDYQTTKAKAQALCEAARGDDLAVTIVCPGAVYGRGPRTDGNYLARVMEMLQGGHYPCLPRMDDQRWCLVDVRDVARGHVLALERGDPDGTYILGGDNVTFNRLMEVMRDGLALPKLPPRVPGWMMKLGARTLGAWHALWGTRPPLTPGAAEAFLHDWAFSSERAQDDLGYTWRPFEEAFPEFVHWFASGARQSEPVLS